MRNVMATAAKLVTVPSLQEIIAEPARVSALPTEAIPALRGELARLDTILLTRLLAMTTNAESDSDDQLLDAAEAAAKLGTSEDWVYRHAKTLPFTVRIGKKSLRFSKAGIDRYIRQRAG